MKLCYIAGPFRGPTPWDVEQHIRAIEVLGLEVARCGVAPIMPHPMTRYFDKQLTDQFWLDATLALLGRCDAILLSTDWTHSTGAGLEYAWARDQQMRTFLASCPTWRVELMTWAGVP